MRTTFLAVNVVCLKTSIKKESDLRMSIEPRLILRFKKQIQIQAYLVNKQSVVVVICLVMVTLALFGYFGLYMDTDRDPPIQLPLVQDSTGCVSS